MDEFEAYAEGSGGADLSTQQLLLRWGLLLTVGAAVYVYFSYKSSAPSQSVNRLGGNASGPRYAGGDLQDGARGAGTFKPAATSTLGSSTPSSSTHSSSQIKKRPTAQQGGKREETMRLQREAVIARMQEELDVKTAAAAKAAEEKAEAQQEAAKLAVEAKAAEKAVQVKAIREAEEQERQKNAALMEEMRRRKEELNLRQQGDAAEQLERRSEALATGRTERAQQFEKDTGPLAVYAKRVEADDKRVHLSSLGAGSSVGDVRAAVQVVMSIPTNKQTLVVNGQVLKDDNAALVDFLRPKTLEVCIMVLQQQ